MQGGDGPGVGLHLRTGTERPATAVHVEEQVTPSVSPPAVLKQRGKGGNLQL